MKTTKSAVFRLSFLLFALLCSLLLLSGCGSKGREEISSPGSNASLFNRTGAEGKAEDAADIKASSQNSEKALSENRKLVRTITAEIETKSFDTLMQTINRELAACGGYVEQSQTEGNTRTEIRWSELTLRVPAAKTDAFLSSLGEDGTFRRRQEKTDDVTMDYVDTQSRLDSLRAEQKALLSLLEKAENLSDIVSLQSRLSEVRYEIESYQSRLRVYDNQVDYATVSLTVQEVERESAVPADRGTFETIGANLSDNFYLLGRGLREIFIWLVSGLPFWLLLALIAVLLVLICRHARKRRITRRAASPAPTAPAATPFAPTSAGPDTTPQIPPAAPPSSDT